MEDLAKVHNGSAPSEYRNPREFFSRTYLTEGLSTLLVGAAKRMSGSGGDPVVELQSNFGGGKTHSMLALYHMVGGTPVEDLPGLDQLMSRSGLKVPAKVNRAVLVGTSYGPMEVEQRTKDFGREYVAATPAGGSADPVVHGPTYTPATTPTSTAGSGFSDGPQVSADPRTFHGTVMISPDRPARDIHQIVEAIIEQLTTIAGADVAIKLEIDANVPAGLDRAKVRTLMENAATLGFIDKVVK